ncbi:cytochrome b/b6 domain-containing protein [Shewanella sp. AS16]|uniref:cytochrome b/b6 domain-containing protein n=1 Tax=Shewanella sp. AS16 TaxID=2907625 RepID=UPI001F3B6942|nr:cytochrome b/b6 domain-containing protein [Shewanella sp. AS16]MCE9687140.1 cytochrome b/b6 domain-containing protein [Shewanella sp. AS16]
MNHSPTQVWDFFIRFFHWTLVAAFIASYLSEGEYQLHFYAGWYIGILLVCRLVWGLVGSKHARFLDFIKPPREIIRYARALVSGAGKKPPHYLGHNPLGGLMVVLLLGSLAMTTASGILLYTTENPSPLAFIGQNAFNKAESDAPAIPKASAQAGAHEIKTVRHEDKQESVWEEIHEFFANFTLLLVLLHVAGVLVSSKLHDENLVKAMFTGKKTTD